MKISFLAAELFFSVIWLIVRIMICVKQKSVDVTFSTQFLGWIFALGDKVKIIEPESAVKQMKVEAKRLVKQYR